MTTLDTIKISKEDKSLVFHSLLSTLEDLQKKMDAVDTGCPEKDAGAKEFYRGRIERIRSVYSFFL